MFIPQNPLPHIVEDTSAFIGDPPKGNSTSWQIGLGIGIPILVLLFIGGILRGKIATLARSIFNFRRTGQPEDDGIPMPTAGDRGGPTVAALSHPQPPAEPISVEQLTDNSSATTLVNSGTTAATIARASPVQQSNPPIRPPLSDLFPPSRLRHLIC